MSVQFNLSIPEIRERFQQLGAEYGFAFQNEDLLLEALTHPSQAAESPDGRPDNQRLEFLGDAVLQMILTDWLYQQLPEAKEGVLTRVRAMLAREETLAAFSRRLGLDKTLLLGHGECLTGGRDRDSNLCDLFESFLGALRLDNGYEIARNFVLKLLPPASEVLDNLGLSENPKGYLQEICQLRHLGNPVYRLVAQEGADHDPVFVVECLLQDEVCGMGSGHSLREAQKAAARDTVRRKNYVLAKGK